jgi:hypothetical protein
LVNVDLQPSKLAGRIFQLFDENKDNKLNLKEFTKVHSNPGHGKQMLAVVTCVHRMEAE